MTLKSIVEVVPYDPNWPSVFEIEAQKIRVVLGSNCIEVHHVGSTAIPGLASKPIIDMIPVVKDIRAVDLCNAEMEGLGYEIHGECGMIFRRLFKKGDTDTFPAFNVHVYEEGSPEIERHLLFRDFLRSNEDDRLAYGRLKEDLASKYPNDIFSYCFGKSDFVASIENRAGFEGYRVVKALSDEEWNAYRRITREGLFDATQEESEEHVYFVLRKGSVIIGAAHIEFVDENRAILRSLVIDRAYQNQGHGSAFLKLIERWIWHQNREVISISK